MLVFMIVAQYREKNQLVTSDIREHWKKTGKVWQRYEISFQGYTNSIVEAILKVKVLIKSSRALFESPKFNPEGKE